MPRKYIKLKEKEKAGRKPKPFNQLCKGAQQTRIRYAKDPEAYEKHLEDQKKRYWKNKPHLQLSKKINSIKQRNNAIEILGGKCSSCYEPLDKSTKRSNLEFHHKYYDDDYKHTGCQSYYDVLRMVNNGKIPNEKYELLCHTCHMIETNIRKNPAKATKEIIRLCENNEIKLPFFYNYQFL